MAISPPPQPSLLSQRQTANNFLALQSCFIQAVPTTAASITFTNLPGNQPVTMKIFNTGASGKHAYVCGSNSAAIVSAVASTTNPQPTSGTNAVSTCDIAPAGAILTQDYVSGTDTISVICAAGISAILEITLGFGQ